MRWTARFVGDVSLIPAGVCTDGEATVSCVNRVTGCASVYSLAQSTSVEMGAGAGSVGFSEMGNLGCRSVAAPVGKCVMFRVIAFWVGLSKPVSGVPGTTYGEHTWTELVKKSSSPR
jgi:hypothetical protein